MRDAISPACAPPIPSATAKSGGSDDVGVLVPAPAAAGVGDGGALREPMFIVRSVRSVPPTRITSPGASRRGSSSSSPLTYVPFVEPDVGDPDAVAPRLDARVARRGEVVAVERDVVLRSRPIVDRARVQGELSPASSAGLARRRAARSRRPWRADQAGRLRLAGREDEALLRQAEVAARGPHDPPDEEVEEHEEEDLEDEQRLADGDRREASHSTKPPLEDEVGRADRDHVAALELRARGAAAVHREPFVESRSISQ